LIWKKKTNQLEQPLWYPPTEQVKYPQWTFVNVINTNKFYLLLDKTKMEFISERAFHSWGKPYISVTKESISGYTKWKDIGFAVGTILCSSIDNTQWFISGKDVLAGERRLITSPDFYQKLGFDLSWSYVVSLAEIDFHSRGEDIIVN